jgi:putative CocE/NonD family hydrolase
MPSYFDWLGHPEYDEYWSRLNWMDAFMQRPIPAYHIGGWYDFLLQGTLQSYKALQRGESSRELFHRLEIGPWVHIPWGRKPGGVDHGPKADGAMHRKQVRWFDYWLKGERGNGLYEETPVRYFESWSRKWEEVDEFPDREVRRDKSEGRMFLSGSATPANGASGGGRLVTGSDEIDTVAAPDVFVYDARLPMSLASVLPVDRSVQQDRYEILVYTSEPLRKEMNLLGTPKVMVLSQTMDGPTDLTAVLTLLLPGGEARFLSVGRREVGLALADQGIGGPEAAEIAMRPLAALCPAGSAIRLELTGSAYPLMLRHPNGMPLKEAMKAGTGDLGIATVAVSSRPGAESWLELPVKVEQNGEGSERK